MLTSQTHSCLGANSCVCPGLGQPRGLLPPRSQGCDPLHDGPEEGAVLWGKSPACTSLGTPWCPSPSISGAPTHLLPSYPAGQAEASTQGPWLPGLPTQDTGAPAWGSEDADNNLNKNSNSCSLSTFLY